MYFSYSFVLLVCVFSFSIENCLGAGPGNWYNKIGQHEFSSDKWNQVPGSSCGGRRKSPIDIIPRETQYYSALKPICITGSVGDGVKLSQEATTVTLKFNDNWKIQFGNTGCFKPISLHWHWGSNDMQGSEHTINGKKYPIEGHLVSFNCEIYNSSSAAIGSPSGLYVIGFFYQIGADNAEIGNIVDSFAKLKQGASVVIPEISLRDFLPKDIDKYYRYEGSLTAPLCTENVIWTVLKEPVNIGPDQLNAFRQLQLGSPESGPMMDNFREVEEDDDSPDYIKTVVYSSFRIGKRRKHH